MSQHLINYGSEQNGIRLDRFQQKLWLDYELSGLQGTWYQKEMAFDSWAWGSGMPRNTNYTFVLQSAFAKDKPIKVK